jgi:hypothetical protein
MLPVSGPAQVGQCTQPAPSPDWNHASTAPASATSQAPDISVNELVAGIRMHVREWKERGEFATEGDPDSSGPTLNDNADWADVTPGAVEFPERL